MFVKSVTLAVRKFLWAKQFKNLNNYWNSYMILFCLFVWKLNRWHISLSLPQTNNSKLFKMFVERVKLVMRDRLWVKRFQNLCGKNIFLNWNNKRWSCKAQCCKTFIWCKIAILYNKLECLNLASDYRDLFLSHWQPLGMLAKELECLPVATLPSLA